MKYSLNPDNYPEDGIMNMATFLRGFEEKGIKNDRPEDQLSKEKKKILFSFCEVCNIQLNSAAQAQVHYNGKSHRKRVKQLSDGQPPPPTQGSGLLLASPGSNASAVIGYLHYDRIQEKCEIYCYPGEDFYKRGLPTQVYMETKINLLPNVVEKLQIPLYEVFILVMRMKLK
ncbi:Zinc finger protein 385B [Galemys pyrenaicus]|uniref:Zinc finger protein 385B n=1 Tax=Galemys pyrenaicus TaxID=202257 RepID=A0A8J6DUH0_GALPY|nr:Zinc finger protein 385B [Galemys pyrenaicus]